MTDKEKTGLGSAQNAIGGMTQYKMCRVCCMDSTASEFTETATGCNFCDAARVAVAETAKDRHLVLEKIAQIKKDGEGKKYDCIIGLSGGVDSSMVLHSAVAAGLRPLCFSVDNGWNDPRADENILRMVETLRVPFYRYTIDLKKFHELQYSFLKAGVPNAEIPTDHILLATTYQMAHKNGIKWILSGGNVETESIMPPSWGANARDLVHMTAIHGRKITGLPTCSLTLWNLYKWIGRIKMLYLLDYMPYNRDASIALLEKKYGYKPYGDKHCENVFTVWFQNFYLYEKFGFDKRKPHYSSMIVSGQMTRDEALKKLTEQLYYPELGFEKEVIKIKKGSHDDYPHDNYDLIAKIVKLCKF